MIRLQIELVDNWQAEGTCFPGAGLCPSDEILFGGEDMRDGLGLDGRGCFKPHFADRCQHSGFEAQVGESSHGVKVRVVFGPRDLKN